MRGVRLHPTLFLPIALALLALVLFLILPALSGTGGKTAGPPLAVSSSKG